MLAHATLERSFAFGRPTGADHIVFGLAGLAIWAHLLDAALIQPQANAGWIERLLQVFLAIAVPPLAFGLYPKVCRACREGMALVAGFVTLTAGLIIHIIGIARNGAWSHGDITGLPMAVAGAVLVLLALVLFTTAIPRRRYRLLMIPAIIAGLALVVPVGFAVFITHAPRLVIEPQDLGAPYEEVAFKTADGLTLRGWYVPSRNGSAVAVLHGSAGARTSPLDHVRMLVRHGYGVLAFDARGHGESDGPTSALGWGSHLDATAAAAYLAAHPDVEHRRVGILGVSMGAEIALESAARSDGFAAIVADGPSGRTFGDTRDSSPPWPAKLLGYGPALVLDVAASALTQQMPPASLTSLAPQVTEPVLYIAAGNVETERTLVEKLAERSGGPSDLWVVEAGHTQGLAKFPDEYERRVIEFFDRLLSVSQRSTR